MADPDTLKKHGYHMIHHSERFNIWYCPDKNRVFINLFDPPSKEEVNKAFVGIAGSFTRPVDLITDHLHMTSVGVAQPEELEACFDRFFDLFEIRYVVRICETEEGCVICVPLDATLAGEEKGRLIGRTANFEEAERLLDQQQGKP
jgi:hypothetical protein